MTKWEYVTVPLLIHATKQILDNWGADGWELVTVLTGPNPDSLVALVAGALTHSGKVGAGVTPEQAIEAARTAALNGLAAAAALAGGLDQVRAVLKVVVYVACDPSFTAQPQVANGASELLGAVFGDAGRHARSAVGVAALPLDAPVEVELIVHAPLPVPAG